MKISNNVIAALALIFIIISVVSNLVVYIKTTPKQPEISGEATGTVELCLNNAPVMNDQPFKPNVTIENPFVYFINGTDSDNTTLTFIEGSDWLEITYYNQTGDTTIGIINLTLTDDSLVGTQTIGIMVDDNLTCKNSRSEYKDYDFEVIMYNRAPVLTSNIPDFTWREDTTLTGLNLDDYFTDPDGDNISYNHTPIQNIRITWSNSSSHVVTFTPDSNWYGLRTVTFSAFDSTNSTDSNVVHLTITNTPETSEPAPASAAGGGGAGGGGGGGLGGAKYECKTDWWCGEWSECLSNKTMIRECLDLNNCGIEDEEDPEVSMACVTFPHCFNGIKDWDEEDVDCGGEDCESCETCYDGIQNQGEEGVDCGGPCPPCETKLATVPCVNVTRAERDILNIRRGELSSYVKLPEGYSIAAPPFNLHCHGRSYELTVSVPDDFTDVRVLRCTGEQCYPEKLSEITELECGGEIMEELLRKETVLQPEFMPITVEKVNLTLKSFEETLKSGSNKVKFYGEAFKGAEALLKMPDKPVPQPKNPSLKIIGTPINIEISKAGNGSLGSVITMPYIRSDEIDEDSIAMYARIGEDEWDYIGGRLDKNIKTVTANVTDIGKYVIDGTAQFALMGILCINCLNSTFLKVHEPTTPSRDAIVLIHGLAGSVASYQNIIDDIKLTDQPLQTWVFGYPAFKGTDKNAKDLMHHLEAHSSEYDRVFIVAHSIGGLIAQQALYQGNLANQEQIEYTFVDKVKKMILVGVPNEGTPAAQAYQNLFKHLVNLKSSFNLFRLDEIVLQELVTGVITPRVPGVDYYVIAGTKPYEFNLLLFKTTTAELLEIFEDSDGIVTVRSAQRVGDGYIKNKCEDFWSINVTHTGLISEPVARKLIERVISEQLLAEKDKPLLGHTSYYKFPVTDCLPDDQLVVIGKKIKKSEIYDGSGCLCGNGVCGEGEDADNCPDDCGVLLAGQRRTLILTGVIGLLSIVLMFFAYKLSSPYLAKVLLKIKSKFTLKKKKKVPSVEVKPLRQTILERLDKLEQKVKTETLETLSREFSVIIREFFRQQFNIEYEFTYEELEKEFKTKKLKPALAHVLGSFFKRITQIEFGGGALTKDELKALIVEIREIIELTAENTGEKIMKEEGKEEITGERIEKKKERKKMEVIKIKGTGLKRIYAMISQAGIYLREGEGKKSKMLYYDVMKTYNKLSDKEKKKVYDAIKRLYDEIKLTKGKKK